MKSLISVLFLVISFQTIAQERNKPELANQLFASGNYYDAITEYKRYVYLNKDTGILDSVFFQIALSHRYSGDIKNSNVYFEKCLASTISEEYIVQIQIEKAINLLIIDDIENASNILNEVYQNESNSEFASQALFYLLIVDILKGNYQEARNKYSEYAIFDTTISADNIGHHNIVINALDSALHIKLNNPRKAKTLSMFIPGLGQVYCNDYFNGVNAFLINGSLLFLTGTLIASGSYLDAAVFSYIFSIFYRGNLFRSQEVCRKARQKQVDEINRTLFDYIISSTINK